MPVEYEVRKIHKVDVKGLGPGEIAKSVALQQFWFVVENTRTGQRFGEHDEEADAIAQCEQLNLQQKDLP